MSNFLIFKAAFNNSATPAIGTYTAEGATANFYKNTSISQDYYLYGATDSSAVQWFVPTAATTDFEFVADILTRDWTNIVTYFIIADSTGTTRLRMWSKYDNWHFENSDSDDTSETEYIGTVNPTNSGGFGVFHQFRVRVRKLTASSSSVEVYVDNTLKLTATTGAALVTCAKIGFVGGVNTFYPGIGAGVKNVYLYDLSNREVIDRDTLSNAFTRFISWAKSIFTTKTEAVLRSGGNLMTGTKLGRPDDSGTFSISGGTTVGGNTGYVKCYGVSASGYPGAVEIGGSNIKFIFRNSAIESWAGNQNLGSSSRQFGTAYIKALNINGTAAGDILTHNASEFVDTTTAQTVAGNKTFSGTTETHDVIPVTTDTYDLGSTTKQWNNAYIKALTINGTDVNTLLSGKANSSHTHSASDITSGTLDSARIPNLDASKITSGTIDIDRLPAGALERLVVVADQTARYALTTSSVQLGDTVKQLDTGIMYYVVDTSKLNSADGYSEYTAGSATSVPWSGVTSKPSSFTPSSHTHTKSEITDFPTIPTKVSDLTNDSGFVTSNHTHSEYDAMTNAEIDAILADVFENDNS